MARYSCDDGKCGELRPRSGRPPGVAMETHSAMNGARRTLFERRARGRYAINS